MTKPGEKSVSARKSGNAKLPAISDAELVVMKVVWAHPPVTANQVVSALENRADWKPKTIQTLLTRLVRKGALAFERRGREYLFRPLIAAEDFAHAASRSFLHQLFDGEIAPFLACFLEREKLSREEIAELRRILEEKEAMNVLPHVLDVAFRWTCQASLAATVLTGLVLLIQFLFGRVLPAGWRYGLGLLILVRLILPFTPASSWSVFNLAKGEFVGGTPTKASETSTSSVEPTRVLPGGDHVKAVAGDSGERGPSDLGGTPKSTRETRVLPGPDYASSAVAGNSGERGPSDLGETPKPTRETRVPPSFKYLWLIGVVSMLFTVFRRHRKFSASLRRWEPVQEPRVLELLESCKSSLGIRRRVTVLAADSLNTPALFGLFRPRLLIPAPMLLDLSDRELRHIILHELVHLRRGDVLINWVMISLRALHWFNPAVWLAFRRIRADQELACDAAVLASLDSGEQLQYGCTLIKLLADFSGAGLFPGAVPFATNKQIIKHRIRMIAAFKPAGRLAVLASLMLLAALISVTFTRAAVTDSNSTGQPPTIFPLLIHIADDGTIRLGNGAVMNVEKFRQTLEAIQVKSPQDKANILPEPAAPAGTIKEVLSALRDNRITAIWLRRPDLPGVAGTNGQIITIVPSDMITITLSADGTIRLQPGKRVIPREELEQILTDAVKKNPRTTLQIERVVGDAPFETPAWIFDITQRAKVMTMEISRTPWPVATNAASGERGQSSDRLAELDSQIAKLKQLIQSSEYVSASNYTRIPEQVQTAIAEADGRISEKTALLRELNGLSAEELRQVLPTTVPDTLLIEALRDLTLAQNKLAGLKQTLSPNHPEFVATRIAVDQANSNVTARVKGILKGLEVQINADKEVIVQLKRQLSDGAEKAKYDDFINLKEKLSELEKRRDGLMLKMQEDQTDQELPPFPARHPASPSGVQENYIREKSDPLQQSRDELSRAMAELSRAKVMYASGSPPLEAALKRVQELQDRNTAQSRSFDTANGHTNFLRNPPNSE